MIRTSVGQYIASGSYLDGQGVKPAEVKWHTLLKGLEAARKDGYELVVLERPGDRDPEN